MKYLLLMLASTAFCNICIRLGANFSDDAILLAIAVVCAGGLAGGDHHA